MRKKTPDFSDDDKKWASLRQSYLMGWMANIILDNNNIPPNDDAVLLMLIDSFLINATIYVDSTGWRFVTEVLLSLANQKKIPEPPVDLEDVSRIGLMRILVSPPKKRGDFRRHLRTLCRFAETGSLRSAGGGDHKGPTRDLRQLQKRLGCGPLVESYTDERKMPRVRPSDTARIISDWLMKHPAILGEISSPNA